MLLPATPIYLRTLPLLHIPLGSRIPMLLHNLHFTLLSPQPSWPFAILLTSILLDVTLFDRPHHLMYPIIDPFLHPWLTKHCLINSNLFWSHRTAIAITWFSNYPYGTPVKLPRWWCSKSSPNSLITDKTFENNSSGPSKACSRSSVHFGVIYLCWFSAMDGISRAQDIISYYIAAFSTVIDRKFPIVIQHTLSRPSCTNEL